MTLLQKILSVAGGFEKGTHLLPSVRGVLKGFSVIHIKMAEIDIRNCLIQSDAIFYSDITPLTD